MKIVSLIAVCVVGAAACSSVPKKTYVEPEDELAQQCISDCNVVRTRCRARGQEVHQQCRAQYEWREREFQFCRQQGGGFCIKPERCKPVDMSICTEHYDGCYQACGGRIEIEDPER